MYSSITYDPSGDFHIDRGGLAVSNTSADQSKPAIPLRNSSWTLSSKNGSWSVSEARLPESKHAPLYSLYTQAPEQDLVFYLNVVLGNGSRESVYPRMMILNTDERYTNRKHGKYCTFCSSSIRGSLPISPSSMPQRRIASVRGCNTT
jgi:hypothetical protein